MKTAIEVIRDFVASITAAGVKVFFFYPPSSEALPLVVYRQVGVLSDSPDGELRETAFTFDFEIWSNAGSECYEIAATVEDALKELPYKLEKLGNTDLYDDGVYRKVVTYRFHWNF